MVYGFDLVIYLLYTKKRQETILMSQIYYNASPFDLMRSEVPYRATHSAQYLLASSELIFLSQIFYPKASNGMNNPDNRIAIIGTEWQEKLGL